jgi:hypothetical protein
VRQSPPERVLGPPRSEMPRPPRRWHALHGDCSPPVPMPRLRPGEDRQGVWLNGSTLDRGRELSAAGLRLHVSSATALLCSDEGHGHNPRRKSLD